MRTKKERLTRRPSPIMIQNAVFATDRGYQRVPAVNPPEAMVAGWTCVPGSDGTSITRTTRH